MNTIFSIRLTITSLEDNRVFYSNEDPESLPLEVELGDGTLFPIVEKTLKTMKPGDEKSFKLAAEDAFGELNAQAVQNIPLDELPEHFKIVGKEVTFQISEERAILGIVKEIHPQHATIDFNHPLAGKEIWLKIVLLANHE